MKEVKYPAHMLLYPLTLIFNQYTSAAIMVDEYVFGTYFAMLFQAVEDRDGVFVTIFEEVAPGFIEKFTKVDMVDALAEPEHQDRLLKIVDRLRSQFGDQVTTTYVKDFMLATSFFRHISRQQRDAAKTHGVAVKLARRLAAHITKLTAGTSSSIRLNLDRLKDVLDLTASERNMLEASYLFSVDVRAVTFKNFIFSLLKNPSMFDDLYKVMLGDPIDGSKTKLTTEIERCFSEDNKLLLLGVIDYDVKTHRMGELSEFWTYVINNYAETDEKFFSRFVYKLNEKKTKQTFSGTLAKVTHPQDEELLKKFIGFAVDHSYRWRQKYKDNLNVLFYGSSRLDKLGYVTKLLDEANVPGYRVQVKTAKAGDIPSICYIAQRRLADVDPMSVLIVEKAEQALTKASNRPTWFLDMFGDDHTDHQKRTELDSDELLLLKNEIPTFWLTNAPSHLTQENVGRFLVHCELRGGSRKDRREGVQQAIGELNLSPEMSQKLSKYLELNVEQIKSAARLVKFIGIEDKAAAEDTLVRLVANSQRALGRERTEEMRDSVTQYSLDLLNISGNMSVPKIIQALKKRPRATLCFYGLPGVGKTQLAEHMAMELDMPLLIKPASEMLNMYLGETEKAIAKAFDDAKAEGAIFLLDEADSFLRDRAMAQRSWEITQVNELLQRMERFEGIFICATNLFEAIDAAALRRFTFKLEFHALTSEQRLKMLSNETGVDFKTWPAADYENLFIEISLIKHLTPGDFATIKRQATLLDEKLSVEDWLKRLSVESRAKLVGLGRNAYRAESAETFIGVTPSRKE